jgi:hypothetical protein
MQINSIDIVPYKNNDSDFKIDFEKIHILEAEFERLPSGSDERQQNISERLKLLGVIDF